jgi:hypothetical protein
MNFGSPFFVFRPALGFSYGFGQTVKDYSIRFFVWGIDIQEFGIYSLKLAKVNNDKKF